MSTCGIGLREGSEAEAIVKAQGRRGRIYWRSRGQAAEGRQMQGVDRARRGLQPMACGVQCLVPVCEGGPGSSRWARAQCGGP